MTKCTLLTDEQTFGNNKLDILNKYGTICAPTDFAILLGAYVSSSFHTSDGDDNKYRAGWWWLQTPYQGDARAVSYSGYSNWHNVNERDGGGRPALPYSEISSIASNRVRGVNGVIEVEYGEYPQTVVDKTYSNNLDIAYKSGSLGLTGKSYTTDSVKLGNYNQIFKARKHIEYEYNGNRYIRFIADSNCENETLSDGRMVQVGDVYWVKVEPIIWLVDEISNIALSKFILFSGVQFKNTSDYNGSLDTTEIKRFMDEDFSKEINSDKTYIPIENNQISNIEDKKQNPYDFDFSGVSEEDIIRGAIESNIVVFLHGRSSEGKSARVKQVDPDCEILYMINATPDSLNGKSVYIQPVYEQRKVPHIEIKINEETKKEEETIVYTYENVMVKEGYMLDIKPSWLIKVEEKCKREKDKLHVIFFDELTNAPRSIQGMAFNIILDGEVNGKWKIPPNARIVAAGNDIKDSIVANEIAEPLFNRCAHVYINTTVDSWLKWASTPNEEYGRLDYSESKIEKKIHPAIYSYIAFKSYSGNDVLRTPYTGDKPNADPRKWEMASKVLYQTNKPEMLRALIGEDLTKDFIAFTSIRVISVEDVINNNYSELDLEMNLSQKFATASGLSSVDDEHFKIVRDFMKKVGPEPKAAFESMWTHGDEKRLEYLAELQLEDSLSQGGVKR